MKNIFYRSITLLVSFSIAWIFIYSLIEFHEHYVFHKTVDLWQVQFLKSADNDSRKTIQLTDKKDHQYKIYDRSACSIDSASGIFSFNLSTESIFSRNIFDSLIPEYILNGALRAPPLA